MWQCCDLDAAHEIQATSSQSSPQAWATSSSLKSCKMRECPNPEYFQNTKPPVKQRFFERSVQQNKASVTAVRQGTRQQHAREGLSYSCHSEAIAVAFIFWPLLSPSQSHWGWWIHSSCAQWKRAAQLLSTAPLCPPHNSKAFGSCRELWFLLLPDHKLNRPHWTCSQGSCPDMSSWNDHVKGRSVFWKTSSPMSETCLWGIQTCSDGTSTKSRQFSHILYGC